MKSELVTKDGPTKKVKKSESWTASKPSGKLLDLISLPDEPILEKYARSFRYHEVLGELRKLLIAKRGEITLVDFGCGQDILFHKFIEYYFPQDISRISYIGIDPLIKPKRSDHVMLISKQFEDTYLKSKADIIVMFAVLEHVDDPAALLAVAYEKLKDHGSIIATTPTWLAKPILEFLSSVIGVISPREIQEHKQYFSKQSLEELAHSLPNQRNCTWSHRYFELGLNNVLVVNKRK